MRIWKKYDVAELERTEERVDMIGEKEGRVACDVEGSEGSQRFCNCITDLFAEDANKFSPVFNLIRLVLYHQVVMLCRIARNLMVTVLKRIALRFLMDHIFEMINKMSMVVQS